MLFNRFTASSGLCRIYVWCMYQKVLALALTDTTKLVKQACKNHFRKKLRFDQNIEISPLVSYQEECILEMNEINLYKHFE